MHEKFSTILCSHCDRRLPASADYFYRNVRSPDGFFSWCKACCREYEAARRKKAHKRAVAKVWREHNPEKVGEYNGRWQRENREKVCAKVKRWEQANPEKVAANARRKRARRDQAPGSHTDTDVRAQYERQKGRCFGVGCIRPLGDEYHVDHFVPIHPRPGDPAGTDDASNIVLMCPGCNLSKSNLHPMDYSGQFF